MTMRQASKKGLIYTGISWLPEHTEDIKKYKEKVEAITNRYNCKVVITTEKDGWMSYFGDENFMLVFKTSAEDCQKIIDSRERRLEKAKLEYETEIERINDFVSGYEEKLAKIKSIEK